MRSISSLHDKADRTQMLHYNVLLFFRILVQICKTKAFQKLNPAQFELHDEVIDAIQVRNHPYF